MAGPVGFRGSSDSISSIQGGAESLLGGGEVRPFSPGYDPSVDPGAGLWRDPNADATGSSDSPFGLDDACGGGTWAPLPGVGGVTLPIEQADVVGLEADLASIRSQLSAIEPIGYIDGGSAFSIPPSGGPGAIDGGSA